MSLSDEFNDKFRVNIQGKSARFSTICFIMFLKLAGFIIFANMIFT